STLAGYYRTYFRTCSSCIQSCLLDKCPEFINLLIGNPLDFYSKTGCICNISIAELFCSLANSNLLVSSNLSVFCDNPSGKIVCSFIAEKAQGFHSLFILFAYGKCCHKNFLLYSFLFFCRQLCAVKSSSAFQHFGISISVIFQTVLKEISPF